MSTSTTDRSISTRRPTSSRTIPHSHKRAGIVPASADDAVAAAAARNARAAQLGSDIVTANNFVNDATGIAHGGVGAVSGVANIGATLLGTRSAVGSDFVSANAALGNATGLYGIAGDIEHPTVAGAVVDSTRVASMIAGSGTTLGTQLAGAATGFGAAYGVVAGFEQGGPLGGLESAASLETLRQIRYATLRS
jgi:hypothetical protein